VEAVKKLKLKFGIKTLRDIDRYLWGESLYNQVKREIGMLKKKNK